MESTAIAALDEDGVKRGTAEKSGAPHGRGFVQQCPPAVTDPHLSIVIPGLDPGTSPASHPRMAGGYIYIMTNLSRRPLYCGVTNDLVRRVYEHREQLIPNAYTSKYRLFRLVYYEVHATMPIAIQREKNVKHWSRAWKAALVDEMNPEWRDLWFEVVKSPSFVMAGPDPATSGRSRLLRRGAYLWMGGLARHGDPRVKPADDEGKGWAGWGAIVA